MCWLVLQIFPVSKHKSFLYLAFKMYLNLTIKSSIKYSIKVEFEPFILFFFIRGQVFGKQASKMVLVHNLLPPFFCVFCQRMP